MPFMFRVFVNTFTFVLPIDMFGVAAGAKLRLPEGVALEQRPLDRFRVFIRRLPLLGSSWCRRSNMFSRIQPGRYERS
jgi:hypothetical protein